MKEKLRLLLFLFFTAIGISYAQSTVTGTVTDGDREPVPGVSVLVKGKSAGTMTSADGRFSIAANVGETLIFRAVGFSETEVTVPASRVVDVQLETSLGRLQEVVVTAMGIKRRRRRWGMPYRT